MPNESRRRRGSRRRGKRGMGRGAPSPANYAVWGSVVSSPSGVWGNALPENSFQCILSLKKRHLLTSNCIYFGKLYDTYFAFFDGLSTHAPLISPLVFAVTLQRQRLFPYLIPNVGPGADPGVQAVSPQLTVSHPPGCRLPLHDQ